jgi:hypothetical protein
MVFPKRNLASHDRLYLQTLINDLISLPIFAYTIFSESMVQL